MGNQIRLHTNAQLQAQVAALTQENTGLRSQLQICLDQLPDTNTPTDSTPLTIETVCEKIDYLNYRKKTLVANCRELESQENHDAFCAENKLAMLCNIIEIEKWKIKLIDQELSCLVFQLNALKNENYEDRINAACHLLDQQIADCEGTTNPFICDVINGLEV